MQTLTISIGNWFTAILERNGDTSMTSLSDWDLDDYLANGWEIVGETQIPMSHGDFRRIVELQKGDDE